MSKISIKEIILSAIGLSLLILGKYLSKLVPGINGYSFLEIYFIFAAIIAILLPLRSSFMAIALAPFLWLMFGLVSLSAPHYPWLSFVLEYELVMFLPLMLNLNSFRKTFKNNVWIFILCLLIGFTKLFIHVFSGVITWGLDWYGSFIYNIPILISTIITTPIIIVLIFNRILDIRKNINPMEWHIFSKRNKAINYLCTCLKINEKEIEKIKKIHNGYTNISFLMIVKNEKWQVRIPKQKNVDWKTEKEIYLHVFNGVFFIDEHTGYMIKQWIKGYTPKKLSNHKKELLKSLNIYNSKKPKINKELDLNKYHCNSKKINSNYFIIFQKLIKKYKNDSNVFCHNDINKKNTLINKNEEIVLIDYEWSQYAPIYFEYAQLWYSNKIKKDNIDENKLNDYLKIYLIFSILWTYSMKNNLLIIKLRIKMKKDLKKIII